jgi:ABC-2 type transport system ATP-binding protein
MATSIVCENVTKNFTLQYHRTFKEVTVALARRQQIAHTFNAVDDVSFTIEQGEAIGLMGLNGSGKSTLLKMINGVMKPDSGTVLTRGRIAGLIATGAGFHPQLSGRDNLILNAAILGMSDREIKRKFDEMVEFSGLEKKLDTQVGHYSSGQMARLGFSGANHAAPDIFLAAEARAVGARPFRRKCMKKMEEIRTSGRTLFYVSHAAASVREMCTRVIVLDEGKKVFDGDVNAGIKFLHYDDDVDEEMNEEGFDDAVDSADF